MWILRAAAARWHGERPPAVRTRGEPRSRIGARAPHIGQHWRDASDTSITSKRDRPTTWCGRAWSRYVSGGAGASAPHGNVEALRNQKASNKSTNCLIFCFIYIISIVNKLYVYNIVKSTDRKLWFCRENSAGQKKKRQSCHNPRSRTSNGRQRSLKNPLQYLKRAYITYKKYKNTDLKPSQV